MVKRLIEQMREVLRTHYLATGKPFTESDFEYELSRLVDDEEVVITDDMKDEIICYMNFCVRDTLRAVNKLEKWNQLPQEVRTFMAEGPQNKRLRRLYIDDQPMYELLLRLGIDRADTHFSVQRTLGPLFPGFDFKVIKHVKMLYHNWNESTMDGYDYDDYFVEETEKGEQAAHKMCDALPKREFLIQYLNHHPRYNYILDDDVIYYYWN